MAIPYPDNVLTDNPQAYYRFNETSGSVANDSSPNNYTAILTGTYTWGQTSLIASMSDTCVLLDGPTGMVSLPAALSLSITTWTGISIEWWTNAEGSSMHIAVVYAAGITTVYFNGTQTMTVPAAMIEVSSIFEFVGSYITSSMGHLAIYNYALSATRISDHLASAAPTPITNPTTVQPQIVPQSYLEATMALSPWIYYRLDEASGPTIYDFSGNNLHATASTTGLTYLRPGALTLDLDTAILFNGTQGFITLPASVNPVGLSKLSISLWINFSSVSFTTSPRLIANAQTNVSNAGFQFAINALGRGGFLGIGIGGSQGVVNFSQMLFTSNVWYHLVGVYDGSLSLLSLYVNGQFNASVAVSGTIANSIYPIALGYDPAYAGDYSPGIMDEVSLFQRALTASQVLNLYSSSRVLTSYGQVGYVPPKLIRSNNLASNAQTIPILPPPHAYQINYQNIDAPVFCTAPASSSIFVLAGSHFILTFLNVSVATKNLLQSQNPIMTFALSSGEMITAPVQITLLRQGAYWSATMMTLADCTVNRWIVSSTFP